MTNDKESPYPRLEIPLNQKKAIFLTIQDFGFLLAFLALIYVGTWLPTAIEIILLISGLLGILITLFSISQMLIKLLFYRTKGLVLGQKGLEDRATLIPAGNIPWERIKDFELLNADKEAQIAVIFHEPKAELTRHAFLKRFWLKWNLRKYGTPVILHTGILQIQDTKLLELLQTCKTYGLDQVTSQQTAVEPDQQDSK